MTFKVELHPDYDNCPLWWKQLCSNYNHIQAYKDKDDAIRSCIVENGGIIHLVEKKQYQYIEYIEFPSEAHFTWFLLKI